MRRRPSTEAVVSFVLVAAAALFVFFALHPSKLFLNTTPAGGDMGAHVWAPDYLRHHLFPHGRISGWAPAWYDGFPALTFYFPLPYLVIAVLSYVLPYGIAFKLVSVAGVVGLPVAAWAFGKLLGMRFPGPPLLALATVPYLFDRYWTIYGGNIASTLAGEFAFAISLCLALLFLGVFSRVLDTGRHRGLAGVLLGATLLCHLLPTFFAIAGALILFALHPSRRRLRLGVVVAVVGFCVAAFWLLPFAARLGYSNDMGWERTVAYLKNLFPWLNKPADTPAVYTSHLKLVVALAAAGALGGIALRRRATLLVTGLGGAAALAFRVMPQAAIWNARMLPFWYLCLYLCAAAGLAEAANAVGILFGRPAVAGAPPPTGSVPLEEPELALVGAAAGGGALEAGSGSVDAGSVDAGSVDAGSVDAGSVDAGAGWEPAGVDDGEDADSPFDDERPSEGNGGRPGAGGPDEADGFMPSRVPAIATAILVALLVWTYVGQSVGAVPWPSRIRFGVGIGSVHFFTVGIPLRFGGAHAHDHNFVTDWANWNYSGYEHKAAYPEYRDVVQTMANVGATDGCGRAMWEYEAEEDRFGTPMALMLLPKWTNGCIGSMEGLFFESSATVPYHFLNQSELSKAPSDAMRNLPYEGLNVADGIAHLRLLGVRYYLAISPETQAAARAVPGVHLVAITGTHDVTYTVSGAQKVEARHWEVFQIDDSDQVAPLSYQPVVMTGISTTSKGWIKTVVPWYQDSRRWDVLLAASGPSEWKRVKGAPSDPPRTPVRPATVTNIKNSDDRISFDVDAPGSPVLVKTSYFPNWQASGARGPWRVAPNLMVVIPTSTHVELHYGFTPVDNIGRVLTLGGLVAAALFWRADRSGSTDQGSPEPARPVPGQTGPDEPVAMIADDDLDRELADLLQPAGDTHQSDTQ